MSRDANRLTAVGSAVWLGLATVVAAQGATGADPAPWWGWVLLGRTHPFIVHFPIGLLIAAAAVEVFQRLRGRRLPTDTGTFCLSAGLVGGALAVWFGTLNAGHQSITGESAVILERHEFAGWTVLTVATLAWLLGRVALRRPRVAGLYLGLLVLVAGAVATTGHFGGQLVYGSTYVSSVLPWNVRASAGPDPAVVDSPTEPTEQDAPTASEPTEVPSAAVIEPSETPGVVTPAHSEPAVPPLATPEPRPAPAGVPAPSSRVPPPPAGVPPLASPAASAPLVAPPAGPLAAAAPDSAPVVTGVSFTREVAPLIRATCVECHGPDKVKARLRMDSVAGLKAGGKSGPLVEPGDPEASLIFRRVMGLDGEDQMPLDADPLTAEQIDLLRRWIAEGARFDASASNEAQSGR